MKTRKIFLLMVFSAAFAVSMVFSGCNSQMTDKNIAPGENITRNAPQNTNNNLDNDQIAQDTPTGDMVDKTETKHPGYTPWKKRVGPAYPGDFWHSFGRDSKEILPSIWDDTVATAKNPFSLITLGFAGTAGIVINASELDNRVQEHVEKHGNQLNTFWDTVGDVGGNPGTHFAIAGAMYFASLANNDIDNYEKSKTLINALAINGLFTLALKGTVRTRGPNGDNNDWPSGHTSSSFTLATVAWNEYGPLVGLPLAAGAAYVGYERVDARNHDFSDVISGALIGIAIGQAVSENHQFRIGKFSLIPFINPEAGSTGLALATRW